MSDYISKDELKERLVYCRGLGRTSLEAVLKAMDNTPALDEKEIIRKAFERVLQRLENIEPTPWEIVKIVKEECGINE